MSTIMIFKEMLTCHDFFLRQVVLIVIKNIFVFDSHSIFVSLVSSKDISKEVQVRVYDSEKERFYVKLYPWNTAAFNFFQILQILKFEILGKKAYLFLRRGFFHDAQIKQRTYYRTNASFLHVSHNSTLNSSFLKPVKIPAYWLKYSRHCTSMEK